MLRRPTWLGTAAYQEMAKMVRPVSVLSTKVLTCGPEFERLAAFVCEPSREELDGSVRPKFKDHHNAFTRFLGCFEKTVLSDAPGDSLACEWLLDEFIGAVIRGTEAGESMWVWCSNAFSIYLRINSGQGSLGASRGAGSRSLL